MTTKNIKNFKEINLSLDKLPPEKILGINLNLDNDLLKTRVNRIKGIGKEMEFSAINFYYTSQLEKLILQICPQRKYSLFYITKQFRNV